MPYHRLNVSMVLVGRTESLENIKNTNSPLLPENQFSRLSSDS
jgi:hypothetical protein